MVLNGWNEIYKLNGDDYSGFICLIYIWVLKVTGCKMAKKYKTLFCCCRHAHMLPYGNRCDCDGCALVSHG